MSYRSYPARHRRRTTADWAWRKAVLQRCNHTCDISGETLLKLEAHHLNSCAFYPEERFDEDNGVALSVKEHILFHEWMGGIHVRCTREDYYEYRALRIAESLIFA
jgi:hypothetical protein